MRIGIDVGGTAIKSLVVDADGDVHREATRPTPGAVSGIVAAVAEMAAALGPDLPVGICVPGIVDESLGIGIKAANMPWANTPLRELFSTSLGKPVRLGHDVRCGARAEARWGAGSADCLFVAIGTGIAAVPIVSGQPLPGIWSGEVGQPVVTDPSGGAPAAVERIASAAAIANRYRQRRPGVLDAHAGAKDVLDLANAGDADAAAVWHEAAVVLAEMLAFATAVTAPKQIVLAGGLALAGDSLLDPLRAELRPRLGVIPMPAIVSTSLGLRGQALGAAALTLD